MVEINARLVVCAQLFWWQEACARSLHPEDERRTIDRSTTRREHLTRSDAAHTRDARAVAGTADLTTRPGVRDAWNASLLRGQDVVSTPVWRWSVRDLA